MTMRDWSKEVSMRIALGALGVACVVTAWTLVDAFRPVPLPDTPVTAIAGLERISGAPSRPQTDIQATVNRDLFSAGRMAPSSPYRMPDERQATDAPAAEPERPIVLGTAVATDGRHFATVQLGDASPTLVHIGDRIGEWVVRAIERGKIVLVRAGGTRAEVTVPNPGT